MARKKKIPHEQYMDYTKVVERGQVLDFYTMVQDKKWWACNSRGGSVEKKGMNGIAKVPAFLGKEYEKVLGYVAAITMANKRPYNYKFVFVRQGFNAAMQLHKALATHYPKNWKKTGRPPKNKNHDKDTCSR